MQHMESTCTQNMDCKSRQTFGLNEQTRHYHTIYQELLINS